LVFFFLLGLADLDLDFDLEDFLDFDASDLDLFLTFITFFLSELFSF